MLYLQIFSARSQKSSIDRQNFYVIEHKHERSLWARYDPDDKLLYPNIDGWDELLAKTIKEDKYDMLSKDEVLSILFGLIHRNRIVEGLWWSMFERGIIQKLLKKLLTF